MLRLTLVLLLVGIPATAAETCDDCKTTYDKAIKDSADNEAKCTAAKAYGKCLFSATGTGCDKLTDKVTKLKSDVTTLTDAVCSITSTCTCQLAYLATNVSTTTAKCAAVTTLNTCATSLSADGCGSETNANVKTAISSLVKACSGVSVVQFSVLSVLAIIAGVFIRS